MFIKATIFLIILLSLASCQNFDAYVARFHKAYADANERAIRQAIYLKKWEQINAVNAQNLGYQLGQNQFTDRTEEQAKQLAGLKKINVPQADPASAQAARDQLRKVGAGTVPLQVDWRTEGVGGKVSTIKNQGSCGSCWAFTTTALYESFLMLGGMTQQPDLAEEYILECTTQNSPNNQVSDCIGGYIDYAIPFAIQTGIPPESAFPYAAQSWTSGTAGTPNTANICTTTNLIKDTTLDGQYKGNYRNLTHEQMKELISYAPIAVLMYANTEFMGYQGGIFDGCPSFDESVAAINHAVVAVGYDTNGNYIIKNSWDTTWGENGFATVSKDADCGFSYVPREIRGTNAQLNGYNLFMGAILLLAMMFAF